MSDARAWPTDNSGSATWKNITMTWLQRRVWTRAIVIGSGQRFCTREIEAAYALTEVFHGFDMAELLEVDQHPNSFDLASRPVAAYPCLLYTSPSPRD